MGLRTRNRQNAQGGGVSRRPPGRGELVAREGHLVGDLSSLVASKFNGNKDSANKNPETPSRVSMIAPVFEMGGWDVEEDADGQQTVDDSEEEASLNEVLLQI